MNKEWLRRTIRSFEPYVVPEIKERTVINANESPYNIFDFPEVKAEFLARLSQTPSYHYPDPFAEELRAALAEYVSCRPEEVLVGCGGDGDVLLHALGKKPFRKGTDVLLLYAVFHIFAEELLQHSVQHKSEIPALRRGFLQLRACQRRADLHNPQSPGD